MKQRGAGWFGCRGGYPTPARDLRVYRHARFPGVRRADQHHYAAALPGKQPGRVGGVDAHLVGAQCPGPGLQRQPDRVEAEFDPAGDGEVEVAGHESVGGGRYGVERGRLCVARVRPARGEAQFLADQVAHAGRGARDDQAGPAGPGRLAQPGIGEGERGHLGRQLLYRA